MATSTSRRAQIAADLRRLITSGEVAQGEKLPTENELAERYDISRNTVRAALAELASEGLVVARRPLGHFVRERVHYRYRPQSESRARAPMPELDQFLTEVSGEGHEASQVIRVSIVAASVDVGRRLGVEPETPVVVRSRVRYLDGDPLNTNDSYYRMEHVTGSEIMQPADVARGCNRVLAELGHGIDRALDEIYVRMPTPEETGRLALPPMTPVAVHLRTGFAADGEPVICTVNVLPGDRHVIVYERHWPTDGPGPDGAVAG
jgi:GntR family transcriptional regulator